MTADRALREYRDFQHIYVHLEVVCTAAFSLFLVPCMLAVHEILTIPTAPSEHPQPLKLYPSLFSLMNFRTANWDIYHKI
jgi:hypothetical protein